MSIDPVWDSTRPIGKLLWRYDRGSYPRRVEQLDSNLSQCGTIFHREEFTTLHRFVLYIVQKPPETKPNNLLEDPIPRKSPGIYRASPSAGRLKCISLFAPASVGHGQETGRKTRRLPHY